MIHAIGSASLPVRAPAAGLPSPEEFRRAVLDSAAEALGLSVQRVRLAFQHGLSLADLAREYEISAADVAHAVEQGIESLTEESGGLPGSPDLAAMARRIVARRGGFPGRRELRVAEPGAIVPLAVASIGDPNGSSSPLAVLSSALGLSQSGMRAALDSGTALGDLLAVRGLLVGAFDAAAA